MHVAVFERIGMGEDGVRFGSVPHIFLNPEIMHAEIEVERGSHADWAQICGAMGTRSHVIYVGEIRNSPQVRDSARVHDGGADIVDQLFLDQLLAIVDAVEHFTDRERRGGVLADDPEALLQFGRRRIF